MKNNINQIKDRIYEAEGLLELLQLRPEKLAELFPLIEARISEASVLLSKLRIDDAMASSDPESHYVTNPQPAVEPVASKTSEVSVAAKTSVESIVAKPSVESAPLPSASRSKTPPSFCLNDRYRFRRTIFAGSDAEFKATMEHLATLDSYSEAEELFIQDMGLNPEDQDVVDFMAIIKDYYKA